MTFDYGYVLLGMWTLLNRQLVFCCAEFSFHQYCHAREEVSGLLVRGTYSVFFLFGSQASCRESWKMTREVEPVAIRMELVSKWQ